MTFPDPPSLPQAADATATARAYYDSPSADTFYATIWGGSHINIGIYPSTSPTRTPIPIPTASLLTIYHMAALLFPAPTFHTNILDMGAGYGGAARYLAKTYGCHVTCLNLSQVENARCKMLNVQEGLEELVSVEEGSFEDASALENASFDVVWSQDAFLHSEDRWKVVGEIARVLRPRGEVVFTDPMAREGVKMGELEGVLERLGLGSLGSLGGYERDFGGREFERVGWEDWSGMLEVHYARTLEEMEGREGELRGKGVSTEYIENMKFGPSNAYFP